MVFLRLSVALTLSCVEFSVCLFTLPVLPLGPKHRVTRDCFIVGALPVVGAPPLEGRRKEGFVGPQRPRKRVPEENRLCLGRAVGFSGL